ncbi:hypothetical protein B484DRAFT_444711 [Ochromonadaceae sp. CCMP2298]|nr:hypothetical protein B484DRAFT_444711 [Ochromonadaceae sp. CCMP2298]
MLSAKQAGGERAKKPKPKAAKSAPQPGAGIKSFFASSSSKPERKAEEPVILISDSEKEEESDTKENEGDDERKGTLFSLFAPKRGANASSASAKAEAPAPKSGQRTTEGEKKGEDEGYEDDFADLDNSARSQSGSDEESEGEEEEEEQPSSPVVVDLVDSAEQNEPAEAAGMELMDDGDEDLYFVRPVGASAAPPSDRPSDSAVDVVDVVDVDASDGVHRRSSRIRATTVAAAWTTEQDAALVDSSAEEEEESDEEGPAKGKRGRKLSKATESKDKAGKKRKLKSAKDGDVQEAPSAKAKGGRTKGSSLFFMSQGQKQEIFAKEQEVLSKEQALQLEQEARERELRIQQEIARTRRENNTMLSSGTAGRGGKGSKKHKGADAASSNPFFLARAAPPKPAAILGASDSAGDASSAVDVAADSGDSMLFPAVQVAGLAAALEAVLVLKQGQQRHRTATAPDGSSSMVSLRPRIYTVDEDAEVAGLQQLLLTHLATAGVGAAVDWGLLEFSNAFQPNRARGHCATSCRASPGQSHMYPLAQAALNLRAAWVPWMAQLLRCSPAYVPRAPPVDLTGGEGPREVLLGWLESWAAKRRPGAVAVQAPVKGGGERSPRYGEQGGRKTRRGRSDSLLQAGSLKRARGRPSRVAPDDSEEEFDGTAYPVRSESDGLCDTDDEVEEFDDDEAEFEEDSDDGDTWSRGGAGTARRREQRSDPEAAADLVNVMVLEGPLGSGKSSAVYDCARRLGYKVIEVNASQSRNGAAIKRMISEAAQSGHIMDAAAASGASGAPEAASAGSAGSAGQERNLILFDEVDVVFDEEETQLYSSIQQLARISKCPLLLTTEKPLPFFKALNAKFVKFERVAPEDRQRVLQVLAESLPVEAGKPAALQAPAHALCVASRGDIRACMATLTRLLPQQAHSSSTQPIDLTGRASSSSSSHELTGPGGGAEGACTFGAYLADVLQLDFASFDRLGDFSRRLVQSSAHCPQLPLGRRIDDGDGAAGRQRLYIPVVNSVSPRSGLTSGGFSVTISGRHFLQCGVFGARAQGDAGVAAVTVLVNGDLECPAQVQDDCSIVAYIPPLPCAGVYTLVVVVAVETTSASGKHAALSLRSDAAGSAGGWLHIHHRRIPRLLQHRAVCKISSSCGNSSGDDVEAPQELPSDTANADSDAPVEISVDETEHLDHANKENIAVRQAAAEGAEAVEEVEGVSPPFASAAFRSQAAKQEPQITAQKKGKKLRCNNSRTADTGSDSDDGLFEEVAGPTVAEAAQTGTQECSVVLDSATLQRYSQGALLVMGAALRALLDNALSEVFLEPVTDRIAPGYSLSVRSPMDLGTVGDSLREGLYMKEVNAGTLSEDAAALVSVPDIAAFVSDVQLVWSNCVQFNGPASPFVRSAYLLNFLFEATLLAEMQGLAEKEAQMQTEAEEQAEEQGEGTAGISLTISDSFAFSVSVCGLRVASVEGGDVFCDCGKLKRSLGEARMQALLADHQYATGAEAEIIPSAEEALAPVTRTVEELQRACVEAEQERASRLWVKRSTGESDTRALIPGCQQILDFDEAGLEYEDESNQPLVLLEQFSAGERCLHVAECDALDAMSGLLERYCDADVFASFAVTSGNYSCLDYDEEGSEQVLSAGCISQVRCGNSYASRTAAARQLGAYGPALRLGAMSGFSQSVQDRLASSSDDSAAALASSLLFGGEQKDADAQAGAQSADDFDRIDSRYLQFQFESEAFRQRAVGALSSYEHVKGSSGTFINGVVCGEFVRSLAFLPRLFALDLLPLLGAMCSTEAQNDADVMQMLRADAEDCDEEADGAALWEQHGQHGQPQEKGLKTQAACSQSRSRLQLLRIECGSSDAAVGPMRRHGRRSSGRRAPLDAPAFEPFSHTRAALRTEDARVSVLHDLARQYTRIK